MPILLSHFLNNLLLIFAASVLKRQPCQKIVSFHETFLLLQIELLWQLLLHRRVPGESRSHVLLRRTDVTGSPVREVGL